jgi:hypothetical protein
LSDLLSSWSRRRAAVAAEAEKEDLALREDALAQEQDDLADKSDEEVLEMLGLPDPDSLMMGDDFKAFMSKAVPEHLRKRALRKLWRSNPVLACVDGLNDYDDDYLAQGLGQGAIKTSYQVGKGMLAHLLEVERAKNAASDVAEVEILVEDGVAEASAEPNEKPVDETAEPAIDADDAALLKGRRMQFQFKDDCA